MAPKSIFRQPDARHFQLVHRSQRDPLIHDPDASQQVLKPFERENVKMGKNHIEPEPTQSHKDVVRDPQGPIGEAALYGIYYDDTQYDYMQHLRPIGAQEDGIESILIEAPSPARKGKISANLELPQTAFASSTELSSNYESQQAIPDSIAGFQPDMDPHLRQVLEALDDDAFVDGELGDDFFVELVKDGERASDENPGFEEDDHNVELEDSPAEDAPWQERFAHFKKSQAEGGAEQSDDECTSEAGDTVHGLPSISVIGGKKRRKGTSQASGYSMSSSSMYRNEALQTLDERFDQLVLKEYREEIAHDEDDDLDEAPTLITSREDFQTMMNEFMSDFEIKGKKLQHKLPGETGVQKLDVLRRAMRHDESKVTIHEDSEDDEGILIPVEPENKQDRWDCESILSTYSNLENHPRLIRARDDKLVPRIHLHPKTGLPTLEKPGHFEQKFYASPNATSDVSDESEDGKTANRTVARPQNESKEDKKLRKAAVKAEKQIRRSAKKMLGEQFEAEMQTQKKCAEIRTNGRTRRL